MNWLTNFVKPKLLAIKSKLTKKENLWTKCSSCGQMNFTKELKENYYVCDNCNFHLSMPVNDRLESIYDDKKYEEIHIEKVIEDPLRFKDKIKYSDRLSKVRKQLNLEDCIKVVKGKINNIKLITAIMDFRFMGGSMGMQVGEGIVKAADEAKKNKPTYRKLRLQAQSVADTLLQFETQRAREVELQEFKEKKKMSSVINQIRTTFKSLTKKEQEAGEN